MESGLPGERDDCRFGFGALRGLAKDQLRTACEEDEGEAPASARILDLMLCFSMPFADCTDAGEEKSCAEAADAGKWLMSSRALNIESVPDEGVP